jgi:hypothetical protein
VLIALSHSSFLSTSFQAQRIMSGGSGPAIPNATPTIDLPPEVDDPPSQEEILEYAKWVLSTCSSVPHHTATHSITDSLALNNDKEKLHYGLSATLHLKMILSCSNILFYTSRTVCVAFQV